MKAPRLLPLLASATLLLAGACARGTTADVERPNSAALNAARESAVARAADTLNTASTAVAAATPAAVEPAARKTSTDYREEIRLADARLKATPRNFEALLTRAKAKSHLKDYKEAMTDYNAAVRLQTHQRPKLYYNRGLNRLKMKEYSGAISDFGKAIKYNPQDKEAYLRTWVPPKCRSSTISRLFRTLPESYCPRPRLRRRLRVPRHQLLLHQQAQGSPG